jgi:hypothetical protein
MRGRDILERPRGRSRGRTRAGRARRWRLASLALLLALGYLVWPYIDLWRLDRALVRNDRETLAALVDLGAVRGEIAAKLNKERKSALGPPSDAFIDWLEQGIRRNGTAALERQVDLDWVRERLLSRSPPGQGMRPALTRAFFDDPVRFSVRLSAPGHSPLRLGLTFRGLGWRVTELYF